MFRNIKLKKFEIAALVITLFAVSFLCGYFVGKGSKAKNISVKVSEPTVQTDTGSTDNDDTGGNKTGESVTDKVNLNSATAAELEALPEIGRTLAERIIEYRETNGKFSAIEDIVKVKGIGEATYHAIKDLITV